MTTLVQDDAADTNRERVRFMQLVDQWRRETRFLSSVHDKVLHHAYQSIIDMGPRAIPWVLEELRSRRGHWFWALRFMTGVDPAPKASDINSARNAWLKWGRDMGLLH